MPPKGVHLLIPKTCECVILHAKGTLQVIEDLEIRLFWTLRVGPM